MNNEDEFIIPKEALEKIQDPVKLKQAIESGLSLQDIFGYNEDSMEAFYSAAYRLFQQKQYVESASAFVFLTMLNPYVSNYWLGLGMSEQLVEEYEAALTAYSMATMLNPKNPICYYHSATCLYALNDPKKAQVSLEAAIDYCAENPEFQDLKKQAKDVLAYKTKK